MRRFPPPFLLPLDQLLDCGCESTYHTNSTFHCPLASLIHPYRPRLGERREPHLTVYRRSGALLHCDHRNRASCTATIAMDNHTKRKCGGIYLPSQVEPQSKLQMARPKVPCPPAGVKTAVEQVGKRQARGGVLLETWDYGTPH